MLFSTAYIFKTGQQSYINDKHRFKKPHISEFDAGR